MVGDSSITVSEEKQPKLKAFECLSCGAPVELRALGQSVCVVCQSCGSIIDTTNENYNIISTFSKKLTIQPTIPLGQRGKLRGHLWEVIGFMQRCDGSGAYTWSEYLLFNPTRGFRWLTEIDGHWNYVTMIKEKPSIDGHTTINGKNKTIATYMGKDFLLFNKGTAKVTYVLGEFYWRVKVNEEVEVEDYIHPPGILSCEKNKEEIVWSEGEYVAADEIKTAFQVENLMPLQVGVAPNQFSTLAASGLGKYWVVFGFLLFVMQMFTVIRAKQERVYQEEFVYQSTDAEKMKVSPPFELKYGVANVDFHLYSPVNNGWLEIEGALVHEQTGTTYEFNQGVEYYSGYDSDGSWSSGEQHSHVLLSSIPSGIYHLNLEPSGGTDDVTLVEPLLSIPKEKYLLNLEPLSGTTDIKRAEPLNGVTGTAKHSPEQKYMITITRDLVTWSNFLWALGLLSLFPLIVWLLRRRFEYSRWSQSNFSLDGSLQDKQEEE